MRGSSRYSTYFFPTAVVAALAFYGWIVTTTPGIGW